MINPLQDCRSSTFCRHQKSSFHQWTSRNPGPRQLHISHLYDQKNAVRGEQIGHGLSGNPSACAIRRVLSRIRYPMVLATLRPPPFALYTWDADGKASAAQTSPPPSTTLSPMSEIPSVSPPLTFWNNTYGQEDRCLSSWVTLIPIRSNSLGSSGVTRCLSISTSWHAHSCRAMLPEWSPRGITRSSLRYLHSLPLP